MDGYVFVRNRPVHLYVCSLYGERSTVRHSIARIHDQVHQDLIYLRRVCLDFPDGRFQVQDYLNVLAYKAAQHLASVRDNVVEVYDFRLQHLFAAEGQKLAGQIRSALPGLLDLLNVAPDGVALLKVS